MTSYLGGVGGMYGRMLANFAGTIISSVRKMASIPHDRRMPRTGNRPVSASPASRVGERPKAGRMEVTNSCQGDDHSTSSLGPSFMPVPRLLRCALRFQVRPQL